MDFLPLQVDIQQFLLSEEFLRIIIASIISLSIYFIFTYLVRFWVGTLLRQLVSRAKPSKSRERQINTWVLLLDRVGGIAILAIFILTVLSELKFNIAPILTGAGILGLAIGLGSQNLMKDIISGIFIFLEGQYTEGDKIKTAGLSGRVTRMTLRKTYLLSEKGSLHIIPNGEVKTITVLSEDIKAKNSRGLPKNKSVVQK